VAETLAQVRDQPKSPAVANSGIQRQVVKVAGITSLNSGAEVATQQILHPNKLSPQVGRVRDAWAVQGPVPGEFIFFIKVSRAEFVSLTA
jgi:hypothetical protein